jgi:hypothetical protein
MRRAAAALLALAAIIAASSPLRAQDAPASDEADDLVPMTFTIVATPPVCPDCIVINAAGDVTPDSSRDFALFIAQSRLKGDLPREVRKGKPAPTDAPRVIVAFDSDGGNVTPALVIGRRIRELGWNTVVGQARVEDDQVVFDEAGCYSACSMMMLGGVERLILPQSKAGVHQFSPEFGKDESFTADDMNDVIREYGRTVTMVYDYVVEMGIDVSFFAETMRTPFAGINVLPSSEWLQVGIATRLLPDRKVFTVEDLMSVGAAPARKLELQKANIAPEWTLAEADDGVAIARFADPAFGLLTVTCIAHDSAQLELTLRNLTESSLDRLRSAALARKRLRIGEREVSIADVAPPGEGEQALIAPLDARDLNALRETDGELALAVINRSGKPAVPPIMLDGARAAKAINNVMASCGGV